MASLQALTIVYITGVTSFAATPGYFYRVDTSASNVTAQLPAVADTDSTDWLIVKNINGDNIVNIKPASGEYIDYVQNGSNQLTGSNQSHQVMPGTPSWMGIGWFTW